MITRVTEDIVLGLMRIGINDQPTLCNIRQVLISELGKYELKRRDTAIAVRDNSDIEMITRFFVAKTSAGLSKRTLQMYRLTLQRIFRHIGKHLKDITTDDVRAYMTMMRSNGVSLVGIDNDRRVLSTFFGWAFGDKLIKENPMSRIEKVKAEKKIKKAFTEDEMEALRIYAGNDRNKAIIEFLYSTGCRVTECEQLNKSDIDFEHREAVVLGKGNKQRRVFLTPRCAAILQQYLSTRKDQEPALFVSDVKWIDGPQGRKVRVNETTRLLKSGIENVVKMAGKHAGILNAHPHRIRRTCATFALRRGMPIEQVSKMLGHASLETTTIYASSTMDEVKQSHDKFI